MIVFGVYKSVKGSNGLLRGSLDAGPGLPVALADTLRNAPVAMGDRAGGFAFHYAGSVSQLEGIMNDKQYLQLLKEKKDVTDLLCERKVRYVVSYEPDLAGYQMHMVHTIRPELSQYPAPNIKVLEVDQVARIADFSAEPPPDALPYLYAWKLRCGSETKPVSEALSLPSQNIVDTHFTARPKSAGSRN